MFKKNLLLIGASTIFLLAGCAPTGENYNEFAKCTTDKGAIMYGTHWCHNCKAQEELFGEAFEYINYIECDPRAENNKADLCLKKGIASYPTWEFSDKSRRAGVQPLDELAKITNCQLQPAAPPPSPLVPNKQ